MAYDARDRGTVFAAINSVIWGSELLVDHLPPINSVDCAVNV
ncbi:MAG: hypothetical protein O3A47_03080 [Chloroflexi bacterium]|nr:hypothetical protein [Chloroflexota bacterium]